MGFFREDNCVKLEKEYYKLKNKHEETKTENFNLHRDFKIINNWLDIIKKLLLYIVENEKDYNEFIQYYKVFYWHYNQFNINKEQIKKDMLKIESKEVRDLFRYLFKD